MNKQEFFGALRRGLLGLPEEDIENSVEFYSEMIDDRIDEGMSEEEAVADIGSVNEVIQQILSEASLTKLVKRKVKKNRSIKVWEIVLLIAGSPMWVSLLLAAIVIVIAIYIVIWSVVLSFFALDLSLALSGLACIAGSAVYAFLPSVDIFGAFMIFGCGLFCLGLSVLLFFGTNQISKGMLLLSKKILLMIKSLFIRKEEVI